MRQNVSTAILRKVMDKSKSYMLGISFSLFLGLIIGGLWGAFVQGLVPGFGYSASYLDKVGRDKLVRIYNGVGLGDSMASVAREVIFHADGREVDVDIDDDGRNVNLRIAFPVRFLWEDWTTLTLCFADEQLEGAHFGTVGAVDVPPDAAPSPKGECTWSPPLRS